MKVEKRINNNVVLASDGEQQAILMGNGIGFQAYPGNEVDPARVEKTFYPAGTMTVTQMAALVTGAGAGEINSVHRILSLANESFTDLNDNVFFTLLDHLSFALKRQANNMDVLNPLEWEIKKFYPKEYQLGVRYLDIIEETVGVRLPDTEATFFALHFVNAQLESVTGEEVFELTELTNAILKLVKYNFQCEFDEKSIFYNRFITHVRYYLMRQMKGEQVPLSDAGLIAAVRDACPGEHQCANVISQYLHKKNGWETSEAEKMYLALHITNLVKKV